ncbi:unnamed protein product [Bursaphelenchus xylophilus]|nr:unnamed protein product [Bursaphelenchus xylophilus]CAG9131679.1 unnamed protein product [Bursaphelenchus xylophilus]
MTSGSFRLECFHIAGRVILIRLRWFVSELCVCWKKNIPPSRMFIQFRKSTFDDKIVISEVSSVNRIYIRPVSFCEKTQVDVDFSAKDLPRQPVTISIISTNANRAGMIFFRAGPSRSWITNGKTVFDRSEAGIPQTFRFL